MPSWVDASWQVPPNVRALTTTRDEGASRGRYASFNLAMHTGDAAEAVRKNRRTLRSEIGLKRLQWLDQVHGNRCLSANDVSCQAVPEADSSWTTEAGLGLVIQSADCVPVVLTDAKGDKIGAAHGGWRGLTSGVLHRLIAAMDIDGPLFAWIGPAIGPSAYEVGADVFDAVLAAIGDTRFFTTGSADGKWFLDLFQLTALLLELEGVTRVHTERLCTYSDARFYSFRRDGVTGRMATVIWKAQ